MLFRQRRHAAWRADVRTNPYVRPGAGKLRATQLAVQPVVAFTGTISTSTNSRNGAAIRSTVATSGASSSEKLRE